MKRLEDYQDLADDVVIPSYQPNDHGVGIVHLGLGAFHRGHMAVYTDDVLNNFGGDWCITGVSLRNPQVYHRLAPQNSLYSLVERSDEADKYRIIGSVKDVLVAPDDPVEVLTKLVDSSTKIVSLTITEKGYIRDAASGALLVDNGDIQYDLENPSKPRTMHGFIVEALATIRANGSEPFTVLSCDNLPANGLALKTVILEFACLRDAELAAWIEQNVAFPSTMVDRIVPATTDEDIAMVSDFLGVKDEAPVICEPFSQWIIEDCFAAPRPEWEKFGAVFVKDVAPYEEMKLRLLNGSHSTLAYLGYLAGFDYIYQAIADGDFQRFVRSMMKDEVVPTIAMPNNEDLTDYCDALIERFSNPKILHRTWQIAMDGSLKIPQRLLNTIRDCIKQGRSYARLSLAVAAWLRYITGVDEAGKHIDVSDPLAAELRLIADEYSKDIPAYATKIMQMENIFGRDLSVNIDFRKEVTVALEDIYSYGVVGAIAKR